MASDRDDRWDDEDDRPRRGGGNVIDRAKSAVSTPAVLLIVTGVFGLLAAALNAVQYPTLDTQFDAQIKQVEDNPSIPADQKKQQVEMMNNLRGPVKAATLPLAGLQLVIGVLGVMGGLKLKNLQSKGLVTAASVLSMLPCVSGCCLIGLPAGIWVLVTLGKPEVKAGFEAVARGGGGYDDDRM